MSLTNEVNVVPEWVRRRDGRQVPFDDDCICQSLFAASEALGTPNAFLAHELTDAVLHFLAQASLDTIPTTEQIADHVVTIVREVGHPLLAHRFAELQKQPAAVTPATFTMNATDSPQEVVERCLQAYSLNVIFSSDLRSAVAEGLLHLSGLTTPQALTNFVVDALALGEDSWWFSWRPWKACGAHWIIDSPEWLSILLADRLPIVRLCERIASLPRAAHHAVELHLNTAEPPSWIHSQGMGPLFVGEDNPFRLSHRFGFLDMLLERCLAMAEEHAPALAWHLHDEAFRDAAQLARLKMLLRHAVQGKAIRFVFDRPRRRVALAEGLDRQAPGVLLEVGLNLAGFAQRPDVAADGVTLLKKLPSLARMAVSAAGQKRHSLRGLPDDTPLKRSFLIERAVGSVVPLGLDAVVQAVTGQSMSKSSLSLDFALRILQTLQDALCEAGQGVNLDMRLGLEVKATQAVSLEQQLRTADPLHACTGSGTVTLLLGDETEMKADTLAQLLRWTWQETAIVGLQLQRSDHEVHQGEFAVS